MSELRESIKRWEHSFLESHGHKPSADDIRADRVIRDMYKRYHASKRAQTEPSSQAPLTPQKREPVKHIMRSPTQGGAEHVTEAASADTDTDVDEATPLQNKVTEIFPTPQFQGRALGLFDLELSPPETPSKRQTSAQETASTPRTPSGHQSVVVETPMSKRTPDYFMRRTDIFNVMASPSRGGSTSADSPLVKRKPARAKSVSELVKEATELQNLQFDGQQELVFDTSMPVAPDAAPSSEEATKLLETEGWTGRVRKGPKRQTKKVNMRPVNHNDLPSMAKPTENYKRLKINNNRGKRPFRRR